FHVTDIAELATRCGDCIVGSLAARDAVCRGHGEVSSDLVVEVDIARIARRFRWASHDSPSASGVRMTPAIAAVSCSQRVRSTASCLRPAAVSRYTRTRCLFSETSQSAAIHFFRSRRWRAGYSDPVSTWRESLEL